MQHRAFENFKRYCDNLNKILTLNILTPLFEASEMSAKKTAWPLFKILKDAPKRGENSTDQEADECKYKKNC